MFLSLHCAFVLFFSESCALFMGPASTFFSKNNFKIWSHGIIHTFKNYFTIVFFAFSFQFLAISSIQIDPILDWLQNIYIYIYYNRLLGFFFLKRKGKILGVLDTFDWTTRMEKLGGPRWVMIHDLFLFFLCFILKDHTNRCLSDTG